MSPNPSPWLYDEKRGTPVSVSDADGNWVASIHAHPDYSEIATARIIAAAPRLLAALKAIMETDGNDLEALDEGMAAIAQAEGRTTKAPPVVPRRIHIVENLHKTGANRSVWDHGRFIEVDELSAPEFMPTGSCVLINGADGEFVTQSMRGRPE